MKSEIVKKGFVYISHYKEPWVRKRRHCMGPKTRLRRVGSKQPGHVDQLTWAKNMTRQNSMLKAKKSCKPNCICKLNEPKLPANAQRKKFQQHEAKKISSMKPYNFSCMGLKQLMPREAKQRKIQPCKAKKHVIFSHVRQIDRFGSVRQKRCSQV